MKWQEVDVSLSKTESFTSEVACVMPFVNRYLARWIAAETHFRGHLFQYSYGENYVTINEES